MFCFPIYSCIFFGFIRTRNQHLIFFVSFFLPGMTSSLWVLDWSCEINPSRIFHSFWCWELEHCICGSPDKSRIWHNHRMINRRFCWKPMHSTRWNSYSGDANEWDILMMVSWSPLGMKSLLLQDIRSNSASCQPGYAAWWKRPLSLIQILISPVVRQGLRAGTPLSFSQHMLACAHGTLMCNKARSRKHTLSCMHWQSLFEDLVGVPCSVWLNAAGVVHPFLDRFRALSFDPKWGASNVQCQLGWLSLARRSTGMRDVVD